MSIIQEPYFSVKAWDVISQRDIDEVDEKSDFLDYVKNELLLTSLCVAQTVELVARLLFSTLAIPYYFVTGTSTETYRNSIIYTALTMGMTIRALYHNLFSKFALVNSVGSASRLFGYETIGNDEKFVKFFENYSDHKEKTQRFLKKLPYFTLIYNDFTPRSKEA